MEELLYGHIRKRSYSYLRSEDWASILGVSEDEAERYKVIYFNRHKRRRKSPQVHRSKVYKSEAYSYSPYTRRDILESIVEALRVSGTRLLAIARVGGVLFSATSKPRTGSFIAVVKTGKYNSYLARILYRDNRITLAPYSTPKSVARLFNSMLEVAMLNMTNKNIVNSGGFVQLPALHTNPACAKNIEY